MQTIQEAVKAIENVKADPELRVNRRNEIGQVPAHQGDVYLTRVADDHARGKRLGTRQVAVGTTVGSRHIVEGEGVEVFEGKTLPQGFKIPEWATEADLLGPLVMATEPFTLTHPEHAHHRLPAGCYQVTYQLDYSTRARVQD